MTKHDKKTTTLLFGATLALCSTAALAQSQDSAVDANGTPVGMAEQGAAGGPQIVGTDGIIRYESADEMWSTISSKWDTLGAKANERWGDIDQQAMMDTEGDRQKLVSLVSESYGIPEEQAEQEVTAWATSADDGM